MNSIKFTLYFVCLSLFLTSCNGTTVFFESFESSTIGESPSTDLSYLPEGDAIVYNKLSGFVTTDSIFGSNKILRLETDELTSIELKLVESPWDESLILTISGAFENVSDHKLHVSYNKFENIFETGSSTVLKFRSTPNIDPELPPNLFLELLTANNIKQTIPYVAHEPFTYTIAWNRDAVQKTLEYTLVTNGVSKSWLENVDLPRPYSYKINWSNTPTEIDIPNARLFIDDIIVVSD